MNYMPYIILGMIIVAVFIGFALSSRKQEDAWKLFASQVGADFIPGKFLRSSSVQIHDQERTITLFVYSVNSGDSSTKYTRMQAPVQGQDGFQVTLNRKSLTSKLDKALGAKDIPMVDPAFDHDFVVRGNDAPKIQALFSGLKVRQLVQSQRSIGLMVKKNVLTVDANGVVKDIERLKSLLDLSKEMLIQLQG